MRFIDHTQPARYCSSLLCVELKAIKANCLQIHSAGHVSNCENCSFPWLMTHSQRSSKSFSATLKEGASLYVQCCGSTLNNQRGREPLPPSLCLLVCLKTGCCRLTARSPPFLPKAPVFIETSALLASCRQEYRSYQINTVGSASPPELWPGADEASESRGLS